MKNILIILGVVVVVPTFGQSDEEAVKAVISKAYVGGIHNSGPIEDIRNGFHPTFNMLRLVDNEVKPLAIEDWIKSIEKNRAESGNTTPVMTEAKFISVAVSGNAANVTLELFRGNKKIFTDHLLLYQFKEGWQIVSKTYFRHP